MRNSAQMGARRSADYLRLVINPLGSVHPLLETAGAEGDLQEMFSNNFGIQQTQYHETSKHPDSWPPSLRSAKPCFPEASTEIQQPFNLISPVIKCGCYFRTYSHKNLHMALHTSLYKRGLSFHLLRKKPGWPWLSHAKEQRQLRTICFKYLNRVESIQTQN